MIRNIEQYLILNQGQVEIPNCPMCNKIININDHTEVATATRSVFLVHERCLQNMDEKLSRIVKIRNTRVGKTKLATKLFKKVLKEGSKQ